MQVTVVALLAALAGLHAATVRGVREAEQFAAVGLGVGAAGEYLATSVVRGVRHHTRPKLGAVPLVGVLSWYAITYAAFDAVEGCLGARGGRWARILGTALVATSLDLLLDVFGLARGFWEWRQDGPYAREITGPNGRLGIPVANFVAWPLMTGGTVAVYLRLTGQTPPEGRVGLAGLVLLAYYLPAAMWASRRGRRRYLVSSLLAPLAVLWGALR
jgi:uncharacterized membrane protein